MITEDYVSFEIAKLMKEKGFNWPCLHYWQEEISEFCIQKGIHRWSTGEIPNSVASPYRFSAPTLQMAMKWLREKHKLFIDIFLCDKPNNFEYNIYKIHDTCLEVVDNEEIFHYNTYEEAAEAVIKHCLENLI